MKKLLFIFSLIFVLMAMMITVSPAMAAVITVDDDGPADYTTIQAAIDAATVGDTITVMPGIYHEWIAISKPLTLTGSANTVLEAPTISSQNGISVTGTHDVSISGFTIRGYRSGVFLQDTDNATIMNNVFENNIGILITDYSGVEFASGVTNSVVAGNAFTGNEYGIIFRNHSNNNVINDNILMYNIQTAIYVNSSTGNLITGNTAEYNDNGIYLAYNANDNIVENNIISNNTIHGFRIEISSFNTCDNNTLANNGWHGFFLYNTAHNNAITGNQINGNAKKGIFINTNSENNTIVGNVIYGNGEEGIELFQNVTYTEIYYNTIENNDGGVYLFAAHNTLVYNNNFLDNTPQISTYSCGSPVFNLTAPTGGNYWSNWNSPDADLDGFVDNPYGIGYTYDYLPWASPSGWLNSTNQPPEAVIDASLYEGTEGGPAVVFNAHGSSDPDGDVLTYRWDFNNDGTWDTTYLIDAGYAYVYPDDYTGPVVLEVSDGEFTDTATCEASISNVPPLVDILADGTYPSPPILVSVGQSAYIFAAFKDVPNDTHTYLWDFGDGESTSAAVSEPEPSPPIIGTNHIYTSPGIYTVNLEVTDDDGGIGEDVIIVIVNVGDMEMRTIGYWKHQIGGNGNQYLDDALLDAYINYIDIKSAVFSEKATITTIADAENLLWLKKASMEQRAIQQLLATWLNVANGAIGMNDLVDTDYDGVPNAKLKDAIAQAETIILDSVADYEQAKNICDSINNM